jgi:NAD(P)-dependent dehydrogenase (short-subunit alcohol dehydrogenase family)
MGEFTGRTVIVTGGAGTLGRAISLAFVQAGANVVLNDLGCSTEGEGSSVEFVEAVVNCVAPAAASRQNERNFADLPLEQQQGFKETYC